MSEDNKKNSMCKIHFIKALSGDSILIELGDGHCILIDCGYKATYESELKPLLKKLHNEGSRLDLLVITHMDEDHIGGAIALIEENGDSRNPKIIEIDNIWFNGILDVCRNYDFLCSHLVEKLSESDYSKKEYLFSQFLKLIGVGDGFISAKHAEAFEVLCRTQNYKLNKESENGLIMVGDKMEIGKWTISVLSPGKNEIDSFAKWINNSLISCMGRDYELEKNGFVTFIERMIVAIAKDEEGICGREPIAANKTDIISWIGTSNLAKMNEANRMSIVLEMECNGTSMLFTGDSESEDWIEKAKSKYDVVKLSHHGSTKPNIALLQNISADKILISTNGRRNHPENDLLARMFVQGIKEVFFNYEIRQKEQILGCQREYSFIAHFEENEIKIEG